MKPAYWVTYEGRRVEGVAADKQYDLKPYEVRVDVGERGARILRLPATVVVVHRLNLEPITSDVDEP